MTVIDRNILAGLERRGLNKKELAELAEVSDTYICYIISGKRAPSLRTLGKISNVLGCTTAELLEDRPAPGRKERRVS